MVSLKAVVFTALFAVSSAYLVDPPTTAPSDTITDCSNWAVVTSTDTCQSLADANFITLTQFNTYNPSVKSKCVLIVGDSYCVEENFGIPPPTTSSTSVISTSTRNGITTPGPIQTGIVTTCNAFYLVKSGDRCPDIASARGISLANFYAWNPAVGSDCNFLVGGDYVCVGIIGGTTLTTSTKSSNGISTPGPIQTGIVGNCNTFYQVIANDDCPTIATTKGITLANFYAWNPAVGSTCTHLIVGDYVCVNIIGGTTLTTITSTKSANGITTPTPIQTGTVGNCNTFYLVKAFDQCNTIASSHGISLADFYLWNPAVGSTCGSLGLGDYVCVNVIGGTTTTSTSTTTTPGNGIATPTPTQAGMWTSCTKFHFVVSGDECGNIATAAGITLASFYAWNPAVGGSCASLNLGYYVCIGGHVSTDGKCGSFSSTPNSICVGSPNGDCCSVKGNCGRTPAYCAVSNLCQQTFGTCTPTSLNGKCGAASLTDATCLGYSSGGCCSVKGNCGGSDAFCLTSNLCQPMFGTCT